MLGYDVHLDVMSLMSFVNTATVIQFVVPGQS